MSTTNLPKPEPMESPRLKQLKQSIDAIMWDAQTRKNLTPDDFAAWKECLHDCSREDCVDVLLEAVDGIIRVATDNYNRYQAYRLKQGLPRCCGFPSAPLLVCFRMGMPLRSISWRDISPESVERMSTMAIKSGILQALKIQWGFRSLPLMDYDDEDLTLVSQDEEAANQAHAVGHPQPTRTSPGTSHDRKRARGEEEPGEKRKTVKIRSETTLASAKQPRDQFAMKTDHAAPLDRNEIFEERERLDTNRIPVNKRLAAFEEENRRSGLTEYDVERLTKIATKMAAAQKQRDEKRMRECNEDGRQSL